MPDIGITDVSTGYQTATFEGATEKGISVTMPEDGTITSVSAYLRLNTSLGSHIIFAVVYDSAGNLVDYSNGREDVSLTLGWETFTGFSGAALSSGQSYRIIMLSSYGAGACEIYERITSGISLGYNISSDYTHPVLGNTKETWSPPDPATLAMSSRDVGVYLTYDESVISMIPIFQYYYANLRD